MVQHGSKALVGSLTWATLVLVVLIACITVQVPVPEPTPHIVWATPTTAATPVIIVVTATPTEAPTPRDLRLPLPDTPTPINTPTAHFVPRPEPTRTPIATAYTTATPRPVGSYAQILPTLTPTPVPIPTLVPQAEMEEQSRSLASIVATIEAYRTPTPASISTAPVVIPPSPTPTIVISVRPTPIPDVAAETLTPAPTQSVMYPDDIPLNAHVPKIEEQIAELTNKAREDMGLPSLVIDAEIGAIARAHSSTMIEKRRFSHSAGGTTPTERAFAAGYTCKAWQSQYSYSYGLGENISKVPRVTSWIITGRTHKNPESWRTAPSVVAEYIVNGWMNSPGHRKNILDPGFRRIGVGVAVDLELEKSGRLRPGEEYWASEWIYSTQNFSGCTDAEVAAASRGTS